MNDWCYRASQVISRTGLFPFVRLHIWHAPGAVEPTGAAVVVANHISHFDPFVVAHALSSRAIDWMTTEEFYENPFAAAYLRATNTFPVNRFRPDRSTLRIGVARLRAGRVVGVFPEGGIRAGAGSILQGAPPKGGATALARLARVPIIPCVILGTDRFYAKGTWVPGPRRTPVWLAVGAPVSVADLSGAEADAAMASAVRDLGAATGAHFSLGPDDWPATPQHRKGRDTKPPGA